MTTQIQDAILYRENWYSLLEEPLRYYDRFPEFISLCTDNHKGYDAVWVVVGEYLFLISLSGSVIGGIEDGLGSVFPGCQAPVRADWYSGELRIQNGRPVEIWDMFQTLENEVVLNIEYGRITSTRTLKRLWNPENLLSSIFFYPINELDLNEAIVNCLRAVNINYIGDLVQLNIIKLIRMTNLDIDSIEKIMEKLAMYGQTLGSRLEGWPPVNRKYVSG